MNHPCLILLAALLCAGCSKPEPAHSPRTFSATGIIKELPPGGKTVVIAHDAISNYMAAMTMPFDVPDNNALRGLKAGDAIRFRLVVTPTDGWVENITALDKPLAPPLPHAPPGFQISRAVEPLDEGELLPNYHFTNELGQPVELSQFKGRVLAFTFFFTSCPFPNFCPRLTSNFAAAATQLLHMTNAPAHWQFLSLSFDPKNDSPARLQAYATAAHYDPAHWSFLTGDLEQITELADNFGENFSTQGGSITHNLRTVVVDATGRIRNILVGNVWTPEELAQDMAEAGTK